MAGSWVFIHLRFAPVWVPHARIWPLSGHNGLWFIHMRLWLRSLRRAGGGYSRQVTLRRESHKCRTSSCHTGCSSISCRTCLHPRVHPALYVLAVFCGCIRKPECHESPVMNHPSATKEHIYADPRLLLCCSSILSDWSGVSVHCCSFSSPEASSQREFNHAYS